MEFLLKLTKEEVETAIIEYVTGRNIFENNKDHEISVNFEIQLHSNSIDPRENTPGGLLGATVTRK